LAAPTARSSLRPAARSTLPAARLGGLHWMRAGQAA